MITGADYVISARMGTREPELVLDIYPHRGYPCCMGATGTDQRQAHKDEIEKRFKLWDERHVIDAIGFVMELELSDTDTVNLIGWILDRSRDLVNGEADGDFVEDEEPAEEITSVGGIGPDGIVHKQQYRGEDRYGPCSCGLWHDGRDNPEVPTDIGPRWEIDGT